MGPWRVRRRRRGAPLRGREEEEERGRRERRERGGREEREERGEREERERREKKERGERREEREGRRERRERRECARARAPANGARKSLFYSRYFQMCLLFIYPSPYLSMKYLQMRLLL